MSLLPTTILPAELLPTIDRRAQREVVRAQSAGAVVTARERAKFDAIVDVTESGLIAAAQISAMEALPMSRCPHAKSRLKHIAVCGSAGIGTSYWA